jgi:CTD nuclear envelope phosphatase 1
MYYVTKRPFCDVFLKTISKWYKIVVFTASIPEYADPVLDWLDPNRLISKRYFRNSCTRFESSFTKDLTIVDSDLSNMVLIDNSSICFALQPDNGIVIESWIHDKNDVGLLNLIPVLDALRFTKDIRSILSLRI